MHHILAMWRTLKRRGQQRGAGLVVIVEDIKIIYRHIERMGLSLPDKIWSGCHIWFCRWKDNLRKIRSSWIILADILQRKHLLRKLFNNFWSFARNNNFLVTVKIIIHSVVRRIHPKKFVWVLVLLLNLIIMPLLKNLRRFLRWLHFLGHLRWRGTWANLQRVTILDIRALR
jgi:hypothetical protein